MVAHGQFAAFCGAIRRRLQGCLHGFFGFSLCFEGESAHRQTLYPQDK
jgi:hypothetical protein